jgi:hypothetical protein
LGKTSEYLNDLPEIAPIKPKYFPLHAGERRLLDELTERAKGSVVGCPGNDNKQ